MTKGEMFETYWCYACSLPRSSSLARHSKIHRRLGRSPPICKQNCGESREQAMHEGREAENRRVPCRDRWSEPGVVS